MTTIHPTDRRHTYDPSSRKAAVTAGLLFLTATVTFLIGDMLITEHFTAPTATVGTTTLTIGVALQAMCGLAVVGIAVALLKVLARHDERLAKGHLAVRCLEFIAILAVGAYILSTGNMVAHHEILIYGFTGTAGLMLTYVLHTARLVPRWLSWMGIVGYVAILAAIPSTLLDVATLDSGPGMLLYVPGGVFEFILPILLIARGFRRVPEDARALPADRVFAHAKA